LLGGIVALAILSTQAPAVAACIAGSKADAGHCRAVPQQLGSKPVASKQTKKRWPGAIRATSGGGGSTMDLRRLAPDLMP
jgi:hypothetical protein